MDSNDTSYTSRINLQWCDLRIRGQFFHKQFDNISRCCWVHVANNLSLQIESKIRCWLELDRLLPNNSFPKGIRVDIIKEHCPWIQYKIQINVKSCFILYFYPVTNNYLLNLHSFEPCSTKSAGKEYTINTTQ